MKWVITFWRKGFQPLLEGLFSKEAKIELIFTENEIDGQWFIELTSFELKELIKPLSVVKQVSLVQL